MASTKGLQPLVRASPALDTNKFAFTLTKEQHFIQVSTKYGLNGVAVDDRLCGVLNTTNIEHAEICYSPMGDGVSE